MRELIERAKAGDHEAFSELGRLWVDRLYAIACLILRDPERATDATQEALIACWRDLRGLRDPDRFDSWIRRILVNACYREARRTQSRHRLERRVVLLDLGEPDPAAARRGSRRARTRLPVAGTRSAGAHCLALLRRPAPPGDGRCARTSDRDRQVPASQDRSGVAREPGRRGTGSGSPRREVRVMSDNFDLDLTTWLDAVSPSHAPEDLLPGALARTERMRQRPRLLVAERWTTMQSTLATTRVSRRALALLIVGLVALAIVAGLLVGRSGPARPGLRSRSR